MTAADWAPILQPVVGGLLTAAGLVAAAAITGLGQKLSIYLVTHNATAEAQAVAAAASVIGPALQTGAEAIADKVRSGQIDILNRAQLLAEAQREVGLVQQRVPAMIAIAQPVEGALVASMISRVTAALQRGVTVVQPTQPREVP